MKRTIRFLFFVLIAAVLFSIAGILWTLLAGLHPLWSPVIGGLALAVSKGRAGAVAQISSTR